MSNLKNNLFSYLTYKININRIDELTNWPPVSWLKKWFIQRMISYDYPQHIFIEITSACNLKCKICPRTSGNTLIGYMDFELFKKIINEANQYGPRTFCLHLFGEPLLAPKFIDEIFYIKKINPKNSIVLTTNGTLLNEKIAKAMIQAPVDKIAISFIAAAKETYFQLTGVDALEKVEENVKRLVKIKCHPEPCPQLNWGSISGTRRKTRGSRNEFGMTVIKRMTEVRPKIIVRMILEEHNEEHNKDEEQIFKKKWKNQGVIIEVRPAHNYGGNVDYGNLRDKKIKKIKRWPCYHFWLSPAIHWNGDFSICCNDYARKAVLGNVKNQTINELWNSPILQKFRQEQLKGNFNLPSICKDCNVWTMYHDIWFWWQKKVKHSI